MQNRELKNLIILNLSRIQCDGAVLPCALKQSLDGDLNRLWIEGGEAYVEGMDTDVLDVTSCDSGISL